jgi:ParB family transcriptional regulator, chromosome partitioning protein
MTRHRQSVRHLPVDALVQHPGNVRDDLGDVTELAASIREHGLLQPLVVTEHADGERYILLAGHRRLAASVKLRLTSVPVIVRHGVGDLDQVVLMLVENLHRRDLDPIERAEAYGAMRHQGLSLAEIARRVGVGVSSVSKYLTLLDLDEKRRDEVRRGALAAHQAIAIVRDVRQETRAKRGGAAMGRPKGVKTALYFGPDHRLASAVRATCTHRDRRQVGGVGCGPCWEETIRRADDTPAAPTGAAEIDEVVVDRILSGDYKTLATRAEKVEVVRRWTAGGRSAAELARLTGWKTERYGTARDFLVGEAS